MASNTSVKTIPAYSREAFEDPSHRESRIASYGPDGWKKTSYPELLAENDARAWGLLSMGIKNGDRICIISHSRLEWASADLAILHAGGITVGIYETNTAEDAAYIIRHCGARGLFVEDRGQFEKFKSVRNDCPTVEWVVTFDKKGFGPKDDALAFDDLKTKGETLKAKDPGLLERTWRGIQPDDVATIVYTSGTTGLPKGVVLRHRHMCSVVDGILEAFPMKPPDEMGMVMLPLAHILQRSSNYAGIRAGISAAFSRGIDTLIDDFALIKPTAFSSVPRVFEKMHARIESMVANQPPVRQKIFNWAISVGKQASQCSIKGQPIPALLGLQRALAEKLVFRKITGVFGGRVQHLFSGGAPISVDLVEFFHAVGILILEGYGLTETAAPCCMNRPSVYRFGSVGQALPGVDVRIAEDGEICVRGSSIFEEYYKDPEATKEAFDADGYFLTGDVGRLDEDGFLYITDRKKDLIITSGGKNIAPSKVLIHGDKRKFLVALITLDRPEVETHARSKGISFADWNQLAGKPEILKMVEGIVAEVNAALPRFESIKKYKILVEDFTAENGTLTATQKVKRKIVESRYKQLLDDMYAD